MTTLEAQHEVITNLILENKKLMQERDELRGETPWGANNETKESWLERQREKFQYLEAELEKTRRERDEAREEWGKASMDAAKLLSEKTKVMGERDEAREALMKIEEIFIDGEDTYEDWKKMGNIARDYLEGL